MRENISKRIFSLATTLIVSFVIFALAGCGGGGDGGGGVPQITYSGITTEAAITPTNGDAILSSAYVFGYSLGEIGLIGAAQSQPLSSTGITYPQFLLSMKHSISTAVESPDQSRWISAAQKTETRSYNGDCGGEMTITLTYDDQTGSFSGVISYAQYCESGFKISGSASISGSLNVNTGNILTFSISSNLLEVEKDAEVLQARLSLYYDLTSSPWVAQCSLWIRDVATAKTLWVDNYTIRVTDWTTYYDITISGRLYHHDYGYVVVTTPTILRLYDGDQWPRTGSLLATGSRGSRGRLTCLSSSQYQIEVDEDGNGTFEFSRIYFW